MAASNLGGTLNLGVPPPWEPWLVMEEMVMACDREDMVECCDSSDEAELFLTGPEGRRGGIRGGT